MRFVKWIEKLIAVSIVFGGTVYSQNTGQNVVSVKVFSNLAIPSSMSHADYSPVLQNVGQTNHQLVAYTSSLSSPDVASFTLTMQGSVDNVTFFNIGAPTFVKLLPSAQINPQVITATGFQSYPYLRVSYFATGLDGSVTLNLFYTGTSVPSNVLVNSLGATTQMQTLSAELVAGTPQQIDPINTVSGVLTWYGGSFDLPTTLTHFYVQCFTGAQYITIYRLSNFTVARTVTFHDIWPVYACTPGGSLVFIATGTGTVGLNVFYREE